MHLVLRWRRAVENCESGKAEEVAPAACSRETRLATMLLASQIIDGFQSKPPLYDQVNHTFHWPILWISAPSWPRYACCTFAQLSLDIKDCLYRRKCDEPSVYEKLHFPICVASILGNCVHEEEASRLIQMKS